MNYLLYFIDANNNGNGQRNIDPVEICATSATVVHDFDMVHQTEQFCRSV